MLDLLSLFSSGHLNDVIGGRLTWVSIRRVDELRVTGAEQLPPPVTRGRTRRHQVSQLILGSQRRLAASAQAITESEALLISSFELLRGWRPVPTTERQGDPDVGSAEIQLSLTGRLPQRGSPDSR